MNEVFFQWQPIKLKEMDAIHGWDLKSLHFAFKKYIIPFYLVNHTVVQAKAFHQSNH